MTPANSSEQSDPPDEDHNPKNCRYTSKRPSLWDRFTFGFLTGIIIKGSWDTLDAKDLRPLHTNFTANDTSSRILRLWRSRNSKAQRGETARSETDGDDVLLMPADGPRNSVNMVSLVIRAFWKDLCFAGCFEFLAIFVSVVPPFLIGQLQDFLDDSSQEDYKGYYIACVLLLSRQLNSLLVAHINGTLFNLALKCRSGMSSAIYQKCLRLSSEAAKNYPTGDVINMISVDLENVVWALVWSNTLWSAPFSITFTFFMLYQYLGVYCLAGAAAVVTFAPIVWVMTKLQSSLQEKHMKKKDERVEMITEVFNNLKILKVYAWENSFAQKIRRLRLQETRLIYIYFLATNLFNFAWNCYPFMVSTAAIAAYMFLDKKSVLDPKVVLVSIAYFNSIRFDLNFFPYAISSTAKALVSLKRIRQFLEAEEVDPTAIGGDLAQGQEIHLQKASFSWSAGENPVLRDIDLSIQKGELVAIVGSVAAGKSSLIQAIIGEMNLRSGFLHRRKSSRIAYVPQQAWILNSTIRNNIAFGASFQARKYQEIVRKCCLLPDLKILPAKDATEIGEKGVNLSGGQKQRVSLARAVYQDADIYLLDDPLSAVDAHVAQQLFDEVIGPGGVLKEKTRILVTHSLAVLPHVDRIVVLENGLISHQGSYEDMMQRNIKLKELVETLADTAGDSPAEDLVKEPPRPPMDVGQVFRKRTTSEISIGSHDSSCVENQAAALTLGRITEEEEMQVGKVRWKVYFEYLWRFGICGVLITLSGYIVYRLADSGSLYYLTEYSSELKGKNATSTDAMWNHMKIYLVFGGVQALAILVGPSALSLGCIWTSTSLHNKMLDAVLRAPMGFFDSTPTGRILNRFSRDVDELDLNLYSSVDGYLETTLVVIVSFCIICSQIPSFVAILLPLTVLFLSIQQFYMASSRQIKRLSAVTKSSVLNIYNESVAGTTSIRAYGVQSGFTRKNMRLLDNNQNCSFHEYNGYRWLSLRLTLIGDLLCFAICCLVTYMRGEMPSWLASLLFSYSLQASTNMTWIVRIGAQVENSLVSAERVLEYSKTTSEGAWHIQNDVKPDWPSMGDVEFMEYSTRYRDHLDFVLRKISMRINAGEKVGIVGRTGAGKSSLTLALLRIIEATEGRILIDGVDISKVGLQTLRSRLAMIPQDPVLFAGTLRENVDPEEKYTDEEVWAALERAHLKNRGKPMTYKVTEGGSNLSVGERQLVCLARALLRNSKVLILDEATAAVDLETDEMIQRTIREDFRSSTVITIAHRLHTIMDYDKIIVLDRGEIREVGSPQQLLSVPGGMFSSMAKDAKIRTEK